MVFDADPVGVRILSALSCEPLYGFDQTCTDTFLGQAKERIDFGDLDNINFKVNRVI